MIKVSGVATAQSDQALPGRAQPAGIFLEFFPDFIPYPAKAGQLFRFAAGGFGRVIKWPVITFDLAGKHRAGGIRMAADGDDGMDGLIQKFLQVL